MSPTTNCNVTTYHSCHVTQSPLYVLSTNQFRLLVPLNLPPADLSHFCCYRHFVRVCVLHISDTSCYVLLPLLPLPSPAPPPNRTPAICGDLCPQLHDGGGVSCRPGLCVCGLPRGRQQQCEGAPQGWAQWAAEEKWVPLLLSADVFCLSFLLLMQNWISRIARVCRVSSVGSWVWAVVSYETPNIVLSPCPVPHPLPHPVPHPLPHPHRMT